MNQSKLRVSLRVSGEGAGEEDSGRLVVFTYMKQVVTLCNNDPVITS